MVWAGVTASGRTPLVFIDKGAKINAQMYLSEVLEAVVKPWAESHFKDTRWTFQQDSAPSHKAKTVQEWCKLNFPDFIASDQWPSYSPDLNPMDFSIWGILESRVCAKPHYSLESLKRSLTVEWDNIPQDMLRSAVNAFTDRINKCIKSKGDHFE